MLAFKLTLFTKVSTGKVFNLQNEGTKPAEVLECY